MNKVTLAIIIVVIAGFLGLVIYSVTNGNPIDHGQFDFSRYIGPDEANGNIGDHIKGNPDALVTIIEWGDFSCSHCAAENATISKMVADYGDKIAFIYRNFPLKGYPNSVSAASFVEAAARQVDYWQISAAFFANQSTWVLASESDRLDIYKEIFNRTFPDADVDQVVADMKDPNIGKKIDFDRNLGAKQDIGGTPAFFINGEAVPGATAATDFKFRQLINDTLVALGQEPGPLTPIKD